VIGRPGHNQVKVPPGTVASPNIWAYPDVYEAENLAVDPDGVIEAAIGELVTDGQSLLGAVPADDWGAVLDIGCGSGFHLPRLAARARQVIGVEPHPWLLARAAARVDALPQVTVRQGTAQALPVPDCSIDLAHARWAYFFGPGAERGLAELNRVCRRGALAVILDHDGTRSTVGRAFSDGLHADGRPHDPAALERFWAGQGFGRRCLDVRWQFAGRGDLAAVLAIEFPAPVAERVLAEVTTRADGWDLDAAVNLWFRRF
jgi:SAM-dependent methyltransferase